MFKCLDGDSWYVVVVCHKTKKIPELLFKAKVYVSQNLAEILGASSETVTTDENLCFIC